MPETKKRLPCRKCVGCTQMLPKRSLIRVVKNDGTFSVDETGKANGRGAYVCKTAACVAAARKGKRFEKAFRAQIPAEIYDNLERLAQEQEVL